MFVKDPGSIFLKKVKNVQRLQYIINILCGLTIDSHAAHNIIRIIYTHLYSSSAGGKDLSNDTQIRVVGSMKPEICTKMCEKLAAKFLVSYSMVKIARLDAAFSEVFERKQVQ